MHFEGAMTIGSDAGYSVTGSSLFVPAEWFHGFQTRTPAHLVYWEPEHSAYQTFISQQTTVDIVEVTLPQSLKQGLNGESAERLAKDCVGAGD